MEFIKNIPMITHPNTPYVTLENRISEKYTHFTLEFNELFQKYTHLALKLNRLFEKYP